MFSHQCLFIYHETHDFLLIKTEVVIVTISHNDMHIFEIRRVDRP